MMRSLFSAVSGLRAHQTKMDVIGNNIANVNTYGFKYGRVTFNEVYSQTLAGASAPAGALGGTNAKQVGLGTSVGSIDNIFEGSGVQRTDRVLDLAVEGEGFFIVQDGNGQNLYTRAGNLYLDTQGNLLTSNGYKVMGQARANDDPTKWAVNADGSPLLQPVVIKNLSKIENLQIDSKGQIKYMAPEVIVPVPPATSTEGDMVLTEGMRLITATFPNRDGLEKVGNNNWRVSSNSGTPHNAAAGEVGHGQFNPGALEMSNVDISREFTDMIVTQRGFQANSRIITVSDTLLEELINLKR